MAFSCGAVGVGGRPVSLALPSKCAPSLVHRSTVSRNCRAGAGSTFGHAFRVTTFGESHGGAVGCIVDGVPPRLAISKEAIQADLDRRRPGQSRLTTPRQESDAAEILSGLTPDGSLTLGTPVCVVVRNKDQRSGDYSEMEAAYRPSHADATYDFKYGIRAIAGGGRASARETVGRVAAGTLAKALLRAAGGTEVVAWVSRVKDVEVPADGVDLETVSHAAVDSTLVRCPHAETAAAMERTIDEVRTRGNSCGGEVTCLVRRPLRGLGSPVFGKLEADLAAALLSLPACKSFEIGSGAAGSHLLGSHHNDAFESRAGAIRTRTNRSGGVQGGISNGEPILVRVCFKPTATISHEQDTVTREGREIRLRARGRHDPCVLPRAVPIVEAMVALVLADALCQHVGQCRVLEGERGAEESAV